MLVVLDRVFLGTTNGNVNLYSLTPERHPKKLLEINLASSQSPIRSMLLCPNGPFLFIGTQEGILTLVKLEEHEYSEKFVMVGS